MGEVIVVASGKGGVGKSTFAVNGAAMLAQQGHRVVLIDMNMGLRNLDLYMGMENNVVYDVADVLAGMCGIRKAMIRDKRFPGLYLICAAQYKNTELLTETHMEVLCKKLAENYDYVIIDASAGIDKNLRLAAAGADKAVVVTVPEFAALRDADMTDRILEKMGVEKRVCCLNKVKAKLFGTGWMPTLSQIVQMIRMDLIGMIPYDDNFQVASNLGMPIVCKEDTYIYKNFDEIMKRIKEL
ncbi:MAG: septum site-determining protein MinD [Firmicutes bacterium]|nr:septum site-determining protein MinD [Bacillota bacterium]MBR7148635.1 septum site-determining protein MinD [Bacillota bacterium]